MPTFLNQDTQTFFPPSLHAVPGTAGGTVQLWDGMNQITAGATLATLTAFMPPNPPVGEVVTILPNQAVTTLTLKDAKGNAVAGVAALVANTVVRMIWSGTAWTKLSP